MAQPQIKGFTLIELIMAIIVVAILAVIATPRFIDLSSDANAALVENMAANFSGALQFVDVEKQLQGKDLNPLDYNGTPIVMINGYPQPSAPYARVLLDAELPNTIWTPDWKTDPCHGSDYCVLGNRPSTDGSAPPVPGFNSGTGLFIWPRGKVLADDNLNGNCFAYYINLADDTRSPLTGYVDTGC